jgi:hypothetical protein
MKTIKFLVACLALVVSTMTANAQGDIQIGYVQPTSVTTMNGAKTSQSMDGIQAGFNYTISVQEPVSLQFGLLYSYLFKTKTVLGVDTKLQGHALDIPVDVVVAFPLASDLKLFAFGGPDLSYMLAKSIKVGNSESYDFYKNNNDAQRFNLQFGIGAGLMFKDFGVKFRYNWGIIDLDKSSATKTVGNGFAISLTHSI